MVVQHNIPAMNANRYFGINNAGLSKSLEKLSSGYAINRAGDNAAGLAVSEKMRSQIAGLTQGVKNAQDGISMVQTYEGALTETHSILQRMKTLATQAAHGTYQNEVDRDAIQYEFDHLNDELNQIADTDFNGVVVLNGGQMADGTKAVAKGETKVFDYANNARQSKQLSASSKEFNALDTHTWATQADTAWNTWSASGGAYDRSDPTKAQGPDSVDITFTYNGDGTWTATGVTDGGMTLDDINGTIAYDNQTAQTNASNGGFILTDGTTEFANVVLDATELIKGDKITLTFNNPAVKNTVSENIGISDIDTSGLTFGTTPIDPNKATVKITNATITSTNNTTTTKVSDKDADLFNALNGATITLDYSAAGVLQTVTLNTSDTTSASNANGTTAVNITTDGSGNNANGTVIGTFKLDAAVASAKKLTIYSAAGDTMAEFDFTNLTPDVGVGTKTSGTVVFTLNTSDTVFSKGAEPTVTVKDNGDTAVSEANAYGQATAPLTYTDHIVMQTGARSKDAVDFTLKYSSSGMGDLKANMNCSAREDGLNTASLSLRTAKDANLAIDKIDQAINKVSMVRATFGAVQNRLEHKIDNMNVTKENMTSAESRIRDTNMAEEMTNFTKNQILSQASQAMLAQANQLPQGVLQLLG